MTPEEIEEKLAEFGVRSEEQERSMELHIAKDWMNRFPLRPEQSPSFLWYLFMTFQKADRENFEMLRFIVQQMISKYRLECTCQGG